MLQTTRSGLALTFLTWSTLHQNVAATPSYAVSYCSTFNTGASGSSDVSIYQSEGRCHQLCLANYAFAVLKDDTCWCSNYAPGSGLTSNGNCNSACPGFPSDYCGNTASGLYGYIALNKSPSGTSAAGAASSTTTPSAARTSTVAATPQVSTVTASAIPVIILTTIVPQMTTLLAPTSRFSNLASLYPFTTTSQAGVAPTTQAVAVATTTATATVAVTPATTPATTPVTTASPIVSVITISGGGYQTVTVTPAAQATNAQATTSLNSNNGGGLSTGGAVGLTIGLVALVAIIGAIVACCYRRRKKHREIEEAAAYEEVSPRGSTAGGVPQRTMSENSRYMLGTDGNRVVEAWQEEEAGSRKSRMIPVDPRLDPFAPVYQRGDANKSRESVATINDGHDYSRRMLSNKGPLRAINV